VLLARGWREVSLARLSPFPDGSVEWFMGDPMPPYSGGTAPVFHRLLCYALAGTRSVYSVFRKLKASTPGRGKASTGKTSPAFRPSLARPNATLHQILTIRPAVVFV